MADADRVRARHIGDLDIGGVDPEDRDVDRGVTAGDPRRDGATIGSREADLVIHVHRVIGGDDQATAPVHAGRPEPCPSVDPKCHPPGALDGGGEVVRKIQ